MSTWREKDNGFCESLIYGDPEYVNSFTSLIIFGFGLLLLFLVRTNNHLIKFICGSITVTGMGSFAFHWTLWKSTGLLDTVPMLFASYGAGYLCLDLITYKYIKIDKNDMKMYQICSNIFALLSLCCLYPGIMITAIDSSNNSSFDILFAIPNIIIIFTTLFMRFYTFIEYYENNHYIDVKRSFISVLLGLSVALFAAILWFITELNCNNYDWMKYTYAHGFWHLGISYGYYHLMMFFVYMDGLIKDLEPYYKKGKSKYEIYLYYIIPVVVYKYENIQSIIPK